MIMICPNCRCVVPNSMRSCDYCGFCFSEGNFKTLLVNRTEPVNQYNTLEYNSGYGYSQELPYGHFYDYRRTLYLEYRDSKFRENFLTAEIALMLIGSIGIIGLLLILAVLVLFI